MHRGGRPYFQLYSFLFCRFMSCDDWPLPTYPPEAGCGRGSLLTTVLLVSTCQRSLCVENNGFEPLTPCLQSRCSSQLS